MDTESLIKKMSALGQVLITFHPGTGFDVTIKDVSLKAMDGSPLGNYVRDKSLDIAVAKLFYNLCRSEITVSPYSTAAQEYAYQSGKFIKVHKVSII